MNRPSATLAFIQVVFAGLCLAVAALAAGFVAHGVVWLFQVGWDVIE